VLSALATELQASARIVVGDDVDVAGLAMLECLLTAHDSPLYGTDATRPRQELHRIAFALQSTRQQRSRNTPDTPVEPTGEEAS
jgi:hypothetical protein